MGQHSSASVSALLDLDGFQLVSAELVGGEWQLAVQTTATVIGCAGCGVRATPHGRRTVRVRDLPIGGRPVVLAWCKRLWRCREPACQVRTWTEQTAAIGPRAVLTQRARAEACRRVGKDAHAVAAVARDLGSAGRPSCGPFATTAPRCWRTRPAWTASPRSGWTRPASSRPPAERRPGRSPAWSTWRVAGCWRWWPTAPGPRWPAGLVLGPMTGWPASARSRWTLARVRQRAGRTAGPRQGGGGPLPRHQAGNTVVDQVRRRTQQATLGHRGRTRDPLYRIRKLLLTAHEQLTQRGRVRLRAGLAIGDPTGEVVAAWQGKELLRGVYAADGPADARRALARFYHWCDGVGVAELSRLARTVRTWEAEILAFHRTGGCSNGPTEAMNLLVKKVKRVGHGFRNFANYRLRLLLHCGVRWQTHRTARLRGRYPRLAA